MKTLAAGFGSLYGWTVVCGRWFYSTVIQPEDLDNSDDIVPPIRYDGDPTEIYLA